MIWLASGVLLGGAVLCLLAAVGVLRLPDVFMRMHAATKAGVVGCGLVLLGVALIDGGLATALKVGLAIVFLLLTTPVASHLLARAAYVSGVPLWGGTTQDDLAAVLSRGQFDAEIQSGLPDAERTSLDASAPGNIQRIVLALVRSECMDTAIEEAIALAHRHKAELKGLAVIDMPRLANVGPVPIGAGWHAQQMRERRIGQARQVVADVIQRFEERLSRESVTWSVSLEEGRPGKILSRWLDGRTMVAVADEGWFDQGVLGVRGDTGRRLARAGLQDVKVLGHRVR